MQKDILKKCYNNVLLVVSNQTQFYLWLSLKHDVYQDSIAHATLIVYSPSIFKIPFKYTYILLFFYQNKLSAAIHDQNNLPAVKYAK